MSISRADVEVILIRRCGALLTAAGLDGATCDGTNEDLNDPIGYGLRQLGQTVTNIAAVADGDLAALESAKTDQLLDLAELRSLENILGNLDDVDIALGPRSEKLSQLAVSLEGRITRLENKISIIYGIGVGALEGGVVTLDFAEHNE